MALKLDPDPTHRPKGGGAVMQSPLFFQSPPPPGVAPFGAPSGLPIGEPSRGLGGIGGRAPSPVVNFLPQEGTGPTPPTGIPNLGNILSGAARSAASGVGGSLVANTIMNQILGQISSSGGSPFNLGQLGAPSVAQGLATLQQILGQQGQTDPRAFNQQLTGIAQNTQAQQLGAQERLAQLGLQNSGVGQALLASLGQAGAAQAAGAQAQEAQLAEQRKRQDLGLLLDLIIGPELQRFGIEQGVAIENQRSRDNLINGLIQGLSSGIEGWLRSRG